MGLTLRFLNDGVRFNSYKQKSSTKGAGGARTGFEEKGRANKGSGIASISSKELQKRASTSSTMELGAIHGGSRGAPATSTHWTGWV